MKKSKILITPGDPAGVGYEILCKFIASEISKNYDITTVAHKFIINNTFENILKIQKPANLQIIEPANAVKFDFETCSHSTICGKAAISYIDTAVNEIISGNADALVTCPINKKSINMAGYDFPGHTEYLAHISKAKNVSMLLVGKNIKTILATTHYPISKVAQILTEEKILVAIENAHTAGRYFGTLTPKIAVCALNPHAGDCGIIGNEEQTVITPAIQKAKRLGYDVAGPFPADTIFLQGNKWDFIIATYHDQGMIAVKMDSFGEAVNVTLNLPFIRTSVDHGTAFDIAWQGIASQSSLIKAVELADKMVKHDKSFSRI